MQTLDPRTYTLFALREGRVLSGLDNCHVPGLVSLVLEPRRSNAIGMLRIFYAQGNALAALHAGRDFALMPHNHRQDITLIHLCGPEPTNVDVALDAVDAPGGGPIVWEHAFGSALLNGAFTLEQRGQHRARLTERKITAQGLFLPSAAIHTVVTPSGAAWAVQEGSLAAHESLCYSQQPSRHLDAAGLYTPMTKRQVNRCVREILAAA